MSQGVDMSQGVEPIAMAGMLQIKNRSKNVIDRLNDGPLFEPYLLADAHKLVGHPGFELGNNLQVLRVKMLEQSAHVTLVAVAFAFESFKQAVQHRQAAHGDCCRLHCPESKGN